MKKIIIPLLLLIVLISISKTFSATTYSGGDVNKDGSINKTDAKLIAQYIISKSKPSNYTAEINVGDVNGDGKVKMNDAVLVAMGKVTITPITVTLNKDSHKLAVNETVTLSATTNPSSTITWSSSDTDVATVSSSGKVTAKKHGVSTITATATDGSKASASIIVTQYNLIDSYESNTLKYYIERPTNYSTAIVYPGADSSKANDQRYVLYRIWVKDAYNQVKTIHSRIVSGNKTSYPMKMVTLGVTKYGYQNKGMVAVNASGFSFNSAKYPTRVGNIAASYVLNADNNGTFITFNSAITDDSVDNQSYTNNPNYKSSILYDAPSGTQHVYGLTKNNKFKRYNFNKNADNNATLKTTITNDGVKYTFNFSGGYLVKKDSTTGKMISNCTYENDSSCISSINPRTSLCQIDEHNFIVLSTTMTPGQNNNQAGDNFRYTHGLNLNTIGAIFADYGCTWAVNLDGGGSQSHVYKKNDAHYYRYYDEPKKVEVYENTTTTYGTERRVTDQLYFVEK